MRSFSFYILSAAIMIMSHNPVNAQNTDENVLTTAAKIEQATVFATGAELEHTARVSVKGGANVVEITGLSPAVDKASIKIKVSGGVMVSAFDFKVEQLASEKINSPLVKMLKDSLEITNDQIKRIEVDIRINDQMQTFLKTGVSKSIDGTTEERINMTELVTSIDSYRSKAAELEYEAMELAAKKAKLNETHSRLLSSYTSESVKGNRREGVLRVNVNSPTSVNATFTVTYFTSQARWTPYYDINVGDVGRPVEFILKSKVVQTTGLDWDKVRLTLSTSIPSGGKIAPLFSTWYLSPVSPGLSRQLSGKVAGVSAAQNVYSYAEESTVDNVVIRGSASPVRKSPLYIINGEIATEEQVANLDASMIQSIDVLKDSNSTAIYGARGADGVIVVTTKTSLDDYIVVEDNTTGQVYNIDILYNVPGNGREQVIELGRSTASAEFKYYAAPRLDTETFLIAEVADWSGLGLLSGPANLTFNGTYLGETYIDTSSTSEKLTLTLGTDKRVVVKREAVKDYSSSKTVGSDRQQTLSYRTTVRNNTGREINMILKDQYPLSNRKDIVVSLIANDTTPYTANNELVGVISWEESIQPGESKTYQISYQVRFPKNVTLNVK